MPSRAPLVSVVIPTYNRPDLLLETLGTVFAQTFMDYEVVVVDDGCTDDTAAQVARFVEQARQGGRVRVVTQANAGIGAARNRAVDESRGKYVALLDHDDLWEPEKLSTQVKFMVERPQCASVSAPWSYTTAPDRMVCDPDEVRNARGIVERPLLALSRNQLFLTTSAMMFDRERAKGVRFAEERNCIEDVPFQLGMMARGAVGIAGDRILMRYRIHGSNFSRQASFYYNGIRMLRRMHREGAFDGFQGAHREDLARYLASIGRAAALRQAQGGYRGKGLVLYAGEFGHQLRFGRARFLLSYPLLLMTPRAVMMRRWPDMRAT